MTRQRDFLTGPTSVRGGRRRSRTASRRTGRCAARDFVDVAGAPRAVGLVLLLRCLGWCCAPPPDGPRPAAGWGSVGGLGVTRGSAFAWTGVIDAASVTGSGNERSIVRPFAHERRTVASPQPHAARVGKHSSFTWTVPREGRISARREVSGGGSSTSHGFRTWQIHRRHARTKNPARITHEGRSVRHPEAHPRPETPRPTPPTRRSRPLRRPSPACAEAAQRRRRADGEQRTSRATTPATDAPTTSRPRVNTMCATGR